MENSIFYQLRKNAGSIWNDYINHPFVKTLGCGTLPKESFKYYLIQDYLFLIQFGRAYALAVYKSENLEDMRSAAAAMDNIINFEIQLHIEFCNGWGISLDDLTKMNEDLATTAYTRFVMDCGNRGDLLDLMTALAPCVIGYAEIGRNLALIPQSGQENPYKNWIKMYSGNEYQKVSQNATHQLQVIFKKRGGSGRYTSLCSVFNQATRMESEFWEMAWNHTN
ncbi:MAG: thiaminase II [Pseudomonadota bacterium]|nr:thiaminase II [Pseudomonadota bacterium]